MIKTVNRRTCRCASGKCYQIWKCYETVKEITTL